MSMIKNFVFSGGEVLSVEQQMEGISAVKKVIFHLSDAGNVYKGASEELPISAEVEGKMVIDSEIVRCQFVMHHNNAEVHIMWEDYGYKAYKSFGLYGSMNTDWQYFRIHDEGVLTIEDKNGCYAIRIEYSS